MPRWLPFAHTPLKASFSVKAELFTRKVSLPAGFRRLNQMAAGFHSFSGDGNLINFIAILRINIPVPTRGPKPLSACCAAAAFSALVL